MTRIKGFFAAIGDALLFGAIVIPALAGYALGIMFGA